MKFLQSFEIFLKIYYPPLIVSIGLVGNFFVLLIFMSKRMRRLSVRNYFMFMTFVDKIGLIQFTQKLLDYAFKFDVRTTSKFNCKFFTYLAFVFGPMSAWIHLLISFERYFSISYLTKFSFMKKRCFQLMIILGIACFNLILYSQIFFLIKLNIKDALNRSVCDNANNKKFYEILNLIDLLNSAAILYMCILSTSIVLVYKIFKIRSKINSLKSNQMKANDSQFAITSISLNVFSLALNLPFCICVFSKIDQTSLVILIFNNLRYTGFSKQFFINYLSNSIFRIEFFKLFRFFGIKHNLR